MRQDDPRVMRRRDHEQGHPSSYEPEVLSRRVDARIDDVLSTIVTVGDVRDSQLWDELFCSLVDLLIERRMLGLAMEVDAGVLATDAYQAEVGELADQCRAAGLFI
jgi:hypothetical protein